MPSLAWTQIKGRKRIGKGYHSDVYLGLLTLPGGRRVSVAYKIINSLRLRPPNTIMAEALVIQMLAGVPGVPRLYGVTDSPPQALVITYCSGVTLKAFETPRTARTFLASLQKTCYILRRMHALGVSHGDVHGKNIIVDGVGDTEAVNIHLVDFGESQIFNDEAEKKLDVLKLIRLAKTYLRDLRKDLYPALYRRRDHIFQLPEATLDLHQVSGLLCELLHGRRASTAGLFPCCVCWPLEEIKPTPMSFK